MASRSSSGTPNSMRRGDGDLAGVCQVVLDEVGDDADAALLGDGDRVQHRGVADQAVRDQTLRQALQPASRRRHVCGDVIHQRAMLPGQTGSIPRTPYRTGPGEEMLNPGRLSPGWRAGRRDPRHRTRLCGAPKRRAPARGGGSVRTPGPRGPGAAAISGSWTGGTCRRCRRSRRATGGVRAPAHSAPVPCRTSRSRRHWRSRPGSGRRSRWRAC